MTADAQSRLSGLNALLAVGGEPLSYGATTVVAVVKRGVNLIRNGVASRDGQVDFTPLGMNEIEIPFGNISQPVAGDSFLDSMGFRHRVRYVTTTDISWVLYCERTQAP